MEKKYIINVSVIQSMNKAVNLKMCQSCLTMLHIIASIILTGLFCKSYAKQILHIEFLYSIWFLCAIMRELNNYL